MQEDGHASYLCLQVKDQWEGSAGNGWGWSSCPGSAGVRRSPASLALPSFSFLTGSSEWGCWEHWWPGRTSKPGRVWVTGGPTLAFHPDRCQHPALCAALPAAGAVPSAGRGTHPLDGQRGDAQHGGTAHAQHQPRVGQHKVDGGADAVVILLPFALPSACHLTCKERECYGHRPKRTALMVQPLVPHLAPAAPGFCPGRHHPTLHPLQLCSQDRTDQDTSSTWGNTSKSDVRLLIIE